MSYNPDEINSFRIFFRMLNSLKPKDLQHFGLVRKLIKMDKKYEDIIEFNCLSPKIAMQEIADQKPALILMTSGTLNKKEHLEETYGIEFRLSENYNLENNHKLHLSTITHANY